MKKILLASNNIGKIKEFNALLSSIGAEVIPQKQLMIEECSEPFDTFIENAIAKARNAAEHSDLPVLADDSGICVNSLEGKPGVRSARFAHDEASDDENISLLLKSLEGKKDRKAFFYCAMILLRVREDPAPLVAIGKWSGEILESERGTGGFGYDPIFFDPMLRKSAAELTPSEKNSVSHRGQAMRQIEYLMKKSIHQSDFFTPR